MTTVGAAAAMKVADEVWVATLMLHQRHSDRADFSIEEIVEFARSSKELRSMGPLRPGVYVHVVQHCVANRPPNPGRYRMLLETSAGRRRLYRRGDSYHPQREGGKITPEPENIPDVYSGLLSWYKDWSARASKGALENDPLLKAQGSGKHLWADEPADEYVRRLREGWE